MVFHIGKVKKVYSPGDKDIESANSETQALIWMWDKNLMVLNVHSNIAGKIKKGDYVLVDYYPVAPNAPHLKRVVVKILKGDAGKETWEQFKEHFKEKKKQATAMGPQIPPQHVPQMFG